MEKSWHKEGKYFGQSYEETDVLDSAVLIMPLVFFIQAVRFPPQNLNTTNSDVSYHQSDPRFLSTLNRVLRTPDKGGLTSNVRAFFGLLFFPRLS